MDQNIRGAVTRGALDAFAINMGGVGLALDGHTRDAAGDSEWSSGESWFNPQ